MEEVETRRLRDKYYRPRPHWKLMMPPAKREQMLIANGTSKEEMQAVVKEVKKAQRQRFESRESQDLEAWYLFKETLQRRFKRWKTGVSKQREQELLWETAAVRRDEFRRSQQQQVVTTTTTTSP